MNTYVNKILYDAAQDGGVSVGLRERGGRAAYESLLSVGAVVRAVE